MWRMLFPEEGGGSLRRFVQFRQTMLWKKYFEPDSKPHTPISLYDFTRHDDAVDAALGPDDKRKDGWRISDDSTIGGLSTSSLHFLRTSGDYQRYLKREPLQDAFPKTAEKNLPEQKEEESGFVPFLRWNGRIDTSLPFRTKITRSGFCAIRSPEFPMDGANLDARYNALELMFRTDGRVYTVNLHCRSYIPGDLHQIHIDRPATQPECSTTGQGPFARLILPFSQFQVTLGGRQRFYQRALDDFVVIKAIGITLMDEQDGDFQFDLARIRAVNCVDHTIVGEEDQVEVLPSTLEVREKGYFYKQREDTQEVQ